MLEIPFLDEIVREKSREARLATAHQAIAEFLEGRFGEVPRDLLKTIESVVNEGQLKRLMRSAGASHDLAAFRSAIARD